MATVRTNRPSVPAAPRHAPRRPPRRAREGPPPTRPTGSGIDPIRPSQALAFGGYTVLLTALDGTIRASHEGLFDLDTRILSRHEILLDGRRPELVVSSDGPADRWWATSIARREGGTPEGPRLPQDALAIHVDRKVGCGMAETITLRNESMTPATTHLAIDVDADFGDRLPATGRAPRAEIATEWRQDDGRLTIEGSYRHDGREDRRGLAVTVLPPPTSVGRLDGSEHGRRLSFEVQLEPRSEWSVQLTYASLADGTWRRPSDATTRPALARAWATRRTRIATSESLVGPAVECAADDLLALRAWELEPEPDGSAWVVNAGVPKFTGFFGRDAITAGWQAAMVGPEPLRGALEVAARSQGQRSDAWTEEQPGRIVHEMRRGPLSMLGVRPHRAYYGSQTSGSMYLLGLSELWHWTGDDDLLRRHRDAALRAIDWAESAGDPDGDGFLEYGDHSEDGLKNQGWKDSDEAIRYPDGRIVDNPISTVEEQAFHYLALQRMAEILVALDEGDRADGLLRRAARLRSTWHDAFWMPDEGFYAMALDPDGKQVASIGSNVGHALGVGIVPPDVARPVADRLMSDDLFSGWGIRTLSRAHASYNPFAYHLGAVWPVENATIALGFKRYGLDDHLDQLVEGMFAAIAHCRDLRLPEALTGHDRRNLPTPLPYPEAQSPQAWSASATIQFLQVLLGLYPFAPAGVLGLIRPRLPEWLPTVTLERLRVGDATVTLRFERDDDGGTAKHTVVEQVGTVRIVEVPPPDAVSGQDGLVPRLLQWALEHAPGRTATAMRIAMGDDGLVPDDEPIQP